MPKHGLVEIVNIIDRSGSMASIRKDAIGGFNTFLQEQKSFPSEARVTLVLFDHEYLVIHDGVPIQDTPDLNEFTYVPRGRTALYDAIGRTILTIGNRLSETPEEERPEKVIISILTDGEENSSTEFTADQIKEMITHQQEVYKWDFIYLAANQDAFEVGCAMGISEASTMSFEASGAGILQGYMKLSTAYTRIRSATGLDEDQDPKV